MSRGRKQKTHVIIRKISLKYKDIEVKSEYTPIARIASWYYIADWEKQAKNEQKKESLGNIKLIKF